MTVLVIVNKPSYRDYTAIKARFPFKRNRLRCVNENRKKRKRLRWQAANHGCHCFDRASIPIGWRLRLLREALAFLAVFVYTTHATQAIAFEWKPGLSLCYTINYIVLRIRAGDSRGSKAFSGDCGLCL